MRKTPLALVATITLFAPALFVGSVQAAEPRPFRGTWTSVDTDGSNQRLDLNGGGSGNYAAYLYDDAATSACGGAPARLTGSAIADGDDLFVQGTLTCSPGGNFLRFRIGLDFHLNTATDTLEDPFGIVWYRS